MKNCFALQFCHGHQRIRMCDDHQGPTLTLVNLGYRGPSGVVSLLCTTAQGPSFFADVFMSMGNAGGRSSHVTPPPPRAHGYIIGWVGGAVGGRSSHVTPPPPRGHGYMVGWVGGVSQNPGEASLLPPPPVRHRHRQTNHHHGLIPASPSITKQSPTGGGGGATQILAHCTLYHGLQKAAIKPILAKYKTHTLLLCLVLLFVALIHDNLVF